MIFKPSQAFNGENGLNSAESCIYKDTFLTRLAQPRTPFSGRGIVEMAFLWWSAAANAAMYRAVSRRSCWLSLNLARPVVHIAAPWDWFSIAAVMLVVRMNAGKDVFMYLCVRA